MLSAVGILKIRDSKKEKKRKIKKKAEEGRKWVGEEGEFQGLAGCRDFGLSKDAVK